MRNHFVTFILLAFAFCIVSCSEGSDEEYEFDNWEQRNDAKTQEWWNGTSMTKYLSYVVEGSSSKASDYIYVEVLESGDADGVCPQFTDSCWVAYRGHLIPTKSYPEGYVFDQTYTGDFDWSTAYVTKVCSAPNLTTGAAGLINGFATALLKMRKGDRWRVHIPYQQAYGKNDQSTTTTSSSTVTIPGYSNLTFEIALYDFWHPGESRGTFKARSERE